MPQEQVTIQPLFAAELEDSEERFRILFEYAPDGYYISDLTGTFVDGNKAAEEITGYKREELIGKNFLKLNLLTARQIPLAAKLLAKNALRRPTGPDELVLNTKSGGQVHVEVRTFPIKIRGRVLVLGIARDITERKKVENDLMDTTCQIIHEEKLSAIGEMTSGITHELRQPLNVLKMTAQSLLMDIAKNRCDLDDARDDLEEIVGQVNKMAEIIDHMRTFTRRTEGEQREAVYINDIIGRALRLTSQQLADNNIELAEYLDSDIPAIEADPVRLEQVLINLINNAKHSVQEGMRSPMKIEIETYLVDAGDFVAVEIRDNGPGIAEETKDRMFKPFFTTKEAGLGTGLGLSISKKIIGEHNGRIEVDSTLEKGATFRVLLPVTVQIP